MREVIVGSLFLVRLANSTGNHWVTPTTVLLEPRCRRGAALDSNSDDGWNFARLRRYRPWQTCKTPKSNPTPAPATDPGPPRVLFRFCEGQQPSRLETAARASEYESFFCVFERVFPKAFKSRAIQGTASPTRCPLSLLSLLGNVLWLLCCFALVGKTIPQLTCGQIDAAPK